MHAQPIESPAAPVAPARPAEVTTIAPAQLRRTVSWYVIRAILVLLGVGAGLILAIILGFVFGWIRIDVC